MTAIETYCVPETLAEAVRLLTEGEATLLAGGTDLMPQTQSGARRFHPLLMNLRELDELKGIAKTGAEDRIRIGALTTVAGILEHELLRRSVPVLVAAADSFASGQVRNRATLGGNICNASPAGDLIIPLLLLDAEVEMAWAADGEVRFRTLPLHGFFTGPGKTRMAPAEIMTAILLPAPDRQFTATFKKFSVRPALDISLVAVGVGGLRSNGGLTKVRVAFGAVAPTPIRARKIEAALTGRALDDAVITAALALIGEETAPISDVRASAWYRRELLRELTGRILRDVARKGN